MSKLDLSLGAVNDEVRTLQAKLQLCGLSVPAVEAAGGYFGLGTHRAVYMFQREHSLPVTGIYDQRTADVLESLATPDQGSPPAPRTGGCCGNSGGAQAPPQMPGAEQTTSYAGVLPSNKTCPWSGKPVSHDAVLAYKDRVVGFCSVEHRDRFKSALEHFERQKTVALEERTCPWSGARVDRNATMVHDGDVVGFCSTAHRNLFKAAVDSFSTGAADSTMAMLSPSAMSGSSMSGSSMSSDSMLLMEEVQDTTFVPPLVDDTVLAQFCQAVQTYADGVGLHDQAVASLIALRARLTNLRNLASLCRLAVVGYPLSFARVIDQMSCLDGVLPCETQECCRENNWCIDPDNSQELTAVVDLLVGAAFVSKDDPAQRDRFIAGIVRAVEDAVAFPVTFALEAAAFLSPGKSEVLPAYAAIVIGNATLRLIDGNRACIPCPPECIRIPVERLARKWMQANPVTAFLEAVSGPKVHQILRWLEPSGDRPVGADVGDPLTILTGPEAPTGRLCADFPCTLGVMFSPHQPAEILRAFENGFQVRVPKGTQTGPVAVVRTKPDFARVDGLLTEYSREYPVAFANSIFTFARIDTWAFPFAFRCPVLVVAQRPATATANAYTTAGPLAQGQGVAVNEKIAIHYSVQPPGSDQGAPPTIHAPGGVVTPGPRPGILFYTPLRMGQTTVDLSWGNLSVTIPVSVTRAAEPVAP
jgi:hypothetical protein